MTNPTLHDTSIEIVRPAPLGRVSHAVLDLDGTVSLLRDGWQDHMVPLLVDVLEECPDHEPREELERLVIDFVDHLTGKQTIYQMIRLAREVEKRGGRPLDPLRYKEMYHERLMGAIRDRLDGLRDGRLDPGDWVLPGSREFLAALRERDIRCYLASGTDVEFVREDAERLEIDGFFDGGIFGALADYESFSKEKVIRKIIADFDLGGPELLIVGDGYVEIQNGCEVGAVTLGLSTRENNRYHMNSGKRERLIRAGAHFIAPDLTDGPALLDHLADRASG